MRHVDGILIPGGFGKRGIQGMVHAITYAREKKVPFFGICLGMQCATIEYARQVSKLDQADSTEFDPSTPNRVIYKLRELLGVDEMGGTMRLGAWPCKLEPGSFAAKAYGTTEISERHRHRYEFNCEYEPTLTAAGFASPAARRTARTSRSWKFPTIRGSSAASFILNSSPSPSLRIRCSPRSCVRAWNTAICASDNPPTQLPPMFAPIARRTPIRIHGPPPPHRNAGLSGAGMRKPGILSYW